MRRYYISEIDKQINKDTICFDTAMRRVRKYITNKIDASFPEREFLEWCDSDTEKPFKWGTVLYYWSK